MPKHRQRGGDGFTENAPFCRVKFSIEKQNPAIKLVSFLGGWQVIPKIKAQLKPEWIAISCIWIGSCD